MSGNAVEDSIDERPKAKDSGVRGWGGCVLVGATEAKKEEGRMCCLGGKAG